VEYDLQGKIKNFFVLWEEADSFFNHKNERVYLIDRTKGTLQFGDGVSNPIPRVTKDTAVLVKVRVCNGKLGNVGADNVEGGLNSLNSIAQVTNPYPAYGGTDTETVTQAVRRGTHLMSSSNRLITVRDFEQEVYVFSDNIARVKCTTDKKGHIILTLLMRDCELETNSFNNIKDKLQEHILKKCEMTVRAGDIIIQEPIFAELSVSLWVKCSQETDVFMLQEEINTCLENFLKPVTGNNAAGWDIGEIPLKKQIIMKLQFLQGNVAVHNFIMNAKYSDETGVHETDAENLRGNPFVVVKSGKHEIHVLRS
jgi:predicted phage baseplate assembly protein